MPFGHPGCCCRDGCPHCNLQGIDKLPQPVSHQDGQVGVSGGFITGTRKCNWSDALFPSTLLSDDCPHPTICDQVFVGFGRYNSGEMYEILRGPRYCTFDGVAVREGAFVCFFTNGELSSIAIGPVLLNDKDHETWHPLTDEEI